MNKIRTNITWRNLMLIFFLLKSSTKNPLFFCDFKLAIWNDFFRFYIAPATTRRVILSLAINWLTLIRSLYGSRLFLKIIKFNANLLQRNNKSIKICLYMLKLNTLAEKMNYSLPQTEALYKKYNHLKYQLTINLWHFSKMKALETATSYQLGEIHFATAGMGRKLDFCPENTTWT